MTVQTDKLVLQINSQNARLLQVKAEKLRALEEIDRIKNIVDENDRVIAECNSILTGLLYAHNLYAQQNQETTVENGEQAGDNTTA